MSQYLDLKGAIEWARSEANEGYGFRAEAYTLLADAAQKWLDAQPKLQWRVRMWMPGAVGAATVFHTELSAARAEAARALAEGAWNIEVLEHPQRG